MSCHVYTATNLTCQPFPLLLHACYDCSGVFEGETLPKWQYTCSHPVSALQCNVPGDRSILLLSPVQEVARVLSSPPTGPLITFHLAGQPTGVEDTVQLLRQVFEDPSLAARLLARPHATPGAPHGPPPSDLPEALQLPSKPFAVTPQTPVKPPGIQHGFAGDISTLMSTPPRTALEPVADASSGASGTSVTTTAAECTPALEDHNRYMTMAAVHATAAWVHKGWGAVCAGAAVTLQFCSGAATFFSDLISPCQSFSDPQLESQFQEWGRESAFNDLCIGEFVPLVVCAPIVHTDLC
jgi:hypothetical protein